MTDSLISRFAPVKSRRMLLGLSIVAATLILALIASSRIFLPDQARQTSHRSPPVTSVPIPVTISSLHMLDMQHGWALTDTGQIVKTMDGGWHWQNVSPPSPFTANLAGVVLQVLDAAHVWVATPGSAPASTGSGSSATQLFRSRDGGQSWQNIPLQTSMVTQITFINPQIGWLLSRHQLSENAETAQILRSRDGGQSWTLVSAALPASTDLPGPGRLPFGGKKTGITFLNEQTGWITGSYSAPGYSFLYRTGDGGQTWNPQALSLAPPQAPAQLAIAAPHFFSATEGILPVTATHEGSTSLIFYATHDGGNSWQRSGPVAARASLSSFVDAGYGWASDGTRLYTTSTEGQQWREMVTNPPLHNLSALDFVAPTTGWALGSTQTNSPSLLKTIDGGQTWTILPAMMIG
ncbi:MAG TPA: hypothetical protein VKR06_03685 [Ktedonosporobacter sp.]|nr:hypothetical protein [Ktedonosporobacter sp.]